MNGVSATSSHSGFPAIAVIRLSPERPVENQRTNGSETVLAAVRHPPRGGEPRPLSALVPAVLARYGLNQQPPADQAVDLVA